MTGAAPSNAQQLPVLMYHRVGEAINDVERKYCVGPRRFAAHMRALAAHGLRACGADEFFAWLDGEHPLPANRFVLTFDDGFRGVYEHALPVLTELGWPATMFLVTAHIGGRDDWTIRDDPSRRTHPLLARGEIAEMSRHGFAFQSHTRHHHDLTTIDDVMLRDELAGARADLEDLLGAAVPYLAYPFGRHDERVVAAARAAGYRAAFSVQPGFNRRQIDRFRIRRLDVFGRDTPMQLLRKLALGSNDGSLASAIRYYAGRVAARVSGWPGPGEA